MYNLCNAIDSYIDNKVKAAKADSLPKTRHKASAAARLHHSNPLHQSVYRKQNLILDWNHENSKSSSKSSSISSSKLESIPHQSLPFHTSHFHLKDAKHQNSRRHYSSAKQAENLPQIGNIKKYHISCRNSNYYKKNSKLRVKRS